MRSNADRVGTLQVLVTSVAALLYLPMLGNRVLVTDEAKWTLSIPYPHPPLLRGLMEWTRAALGDSTLVVRLPAAVLSAVAVGLLCRWLLRRGGSGSFAVAASLAFAMTSGYAVWARSAYLSAPLAACWLVALLGVDRLERDPGDRSGHWLLLGGTAAGIWSQFHGVLILPAVAWTYWRTRDALKDHRALLVFPILQLASICLVALYMAGSPLIVHDFLFEAGRHPIGADGSLPRAIMASGPFVQYWIIGATLVAVLLGRQIRFPGRPADEAAAVLFLASLLWLVANPKGYYLPYLALPAWVCGAWLWGLGRSRPVLAGLALASILVRPFDGIDRSMEEFYMTRAPEWVSRVAGDSSVAFLGAYGYEAQFTSPVPVRKMPRDDDARSEIRHALVVRPGSLSPEESAWLAGEFVLVREIGAARLYARVAADRSGGQPHEGTGADER